MKKTTKEWLNSAESDLLLIKEISLNENLTHLSAFHAQQAIEKSFKAVIEEFDLGFVKTHSLETLYNIVKEIILLKGDTDMFIILDQLYIDARYPGKWVYYLMGNPLFQKEKNF